MQKTKIEWCDYTINCFWGCENGCSYCQARSMAKRFGRRIGTARKYTQDIIEHMAKFEPVFLPDQLSRIAKIKEPSRIFISFMGDAFADNYSHECLDLVFRWVNTHKQHTFIFLTKQPQNLIEWNPFPDNCWVGVSATDNEMAFNASCNLISVQAKVKFISFEPLLGHIGKAVLDLLTNSKGINWIICGQQTPVSRKTQPKIEWIYDILQAANKARIPVFLKDNLRSLLPNREPFRIPIRWREPPGVTMMENVLRQEFPNLTV